MSPYEMQQSWNGLINLSFHSLNLSCFFDLAICTWLGSVENVLRNCLEFSWKIANCQENNWDGGALLAMR